MSLRDAAKVYRLRPKLLGATVRHGHAIAIHLSDHQVSLLARATYIAAFCLPLGARIGPRTCLDPVTPRASVDAKALSRLLGPRTSLLKPASKKTPPPPWRHRGTIQASSGLERAHDDALHLLTHLRLRPGAQVAKQHLRPGRQGSRRHLDLVAVDLRDRQPLHLVALLRIQWWMWPSEAPPCTRPGPCRAAGCSTARRWTPQRRSGRTRRTSAPPGLRPASHGTVGSRAPRCLARALPLWPCHPPVIFCPTLKDVGFGADTGPVALTAIWQLRPRVQTILLGTC